MNKKLVKYLLLSSFIGTAAEQMIIPLYGIFVNQIGGGILEAGIGMAIFSIITGLIIIGAGKIKWFSDHTYLLVLLGFAISAVGDFAYFFVHNATSLFIVQATNGISVGLLNPAWESLYAQNTEEGEEHESWSNWGGGAEISTGIAALLGAGVAHLFGFRTMFVCTAFINIVAVYYAFMVYKMRKNGN
jgi:predicted MFS family arabinose efflux permease